ncbi:MAG: FAD-dependent oxidoreductase [Christensenellaceae bacterium]|nr:FAD-dependent oxidoreductase [Christensenellaceae bacterium]
MLEKHVDILIIGGGPAGLAAAIGAKEQGVDDILVIEREDSLGGILGQCIHNGFGLHRFKVEMTGPEYAQMDIDKVRELGIPTLCDTMVLSVDENRRVVAINKEQGLMVFNAGAVILAMGCRERPFGALGIAGTRCSGIFSAGTAQKYVNLMGFIPGKKVFILGSGDIGLIMARRMTLQGSEVLGVAEIMPYSSGLNRNIVQCLDDYGIPLYLKHTVIEVRGKERLEGVTIAEVDDMRKPIPGTEKHFDCDTLLLSVGLIPENELSQGANVEMSNTTSGPIVDDEFQTSKAGIFACGNVLHVHDLVDFVSDESMKAGKAAANFINKKTKKGTIINMLDGKGVRGVVPQKLKIPVDGEDAENVQVMFRPDKVYENARVKVYNGDNEIYSVKKRILAPGEMADIILKKDIIQNLQNAPIRVDIES